MRDERSGEGARGVDATCQAERRLDVEAIGRVIAAHRSLLQRAAARILGCGDAARDAVQEALITLWLDPPSQGEEKAWLLRTVIHRSLHERRTRLRRERWEGAAAQEWVEDCPICSPQRDVETRELARAFDEALAAMPEPYRATFALRELDGRDYDQIAGDLGVPVGTVRSRLNRARSMLRARVAPDGEDAEA